jgi:hypothetical protein
MDFIKYTPVGEQTILQRGEIINNLTSSLWVERYSEPGEFSFEAQLSTGIRQQLPLGTLITHQETKEVMIVENHEIKETTQEDPAVVITGRSFASYLENRIIGMTLARASSTISTYDLVAGYSWVQIVKIINDHIVTGNAGDTLANITVTHGMGAATSPTSIARTINRGTVWAAVAELLKIDDLGIKFMRSTNVASNSFFLVYKGTDQSSKVIFSWQAGDLSSADYLFTQKSDNNSALVVGTYLFVIVDEGPDKYDRRFILVDATDIDGHLGALPTGAPLTTAIAAMQTRGSQVLRSNNPQTISRTDISETTKYQYRKDYNLGDLVTLDGNFNAIQKMRVVEYAEIEDENGESGHPTLALPLP